MELTSSATNKNGTGSSLSTLHIRHSQAADYYENLATRLEEDNQATISLVNSLSTYHNKAAQVFATALEVLPNTPVKPNKDMQFTTDSIIPPAAPAGVVALTLKRNEEAFLDVYKGLLDNNGLPDALWEKIQHQSERAQEVVRKLDRISKTGEERDMRA